MDEFEQPPFPPLPTGELTGAPAATPDALREILRRHRRRLGAAVATGLAVVLVAGVAGGWAVGRSGRSSSSGVQVAAGTPSGKGLGASQPAVAPVPGATSGGPAIVVSGGVSTGGGGPSTQVLVRNATDGTRVRLYEGTIGNLAIKCSGPAACPPSAQPAIACAPSSIVNAEVSDDQVAGVADGVVWNSTVTDPLDVVTIDVVGAGQPQPILVVIARTSGSTAKVSLTVTTPSATDSAAPTAGWVALAVQLPAGFTTDPSTGLPSGTVAALDAGGTTLSSTPLGATANGKVPPCDVPCGATSPTGCNVGCGVVGPPTPAPSPAGTAPATPPTPANTPACVSTCVLPAVGSATTGPVPPSGNAPVQGCVVSGGVGSASSGSGYATGGSVGSSGPASTLVVTVPPTAAP